MLSTTFSVSLLLCLISDFTYGRNIAVSVGDDYTYIEAVDSYYKIHTTPKQWRDAKLACAQEGGSLLYPENSDEANAVIKFWKQYQNSTPVDETWVYVGMSDIITEGVYETIHGKPISDVYNNWKVGMPDNRGDEDCIHLNQEGVINDIRCDKEYSFICKKSINQNCTCEIEQSEASKASFLEDYTYIEAVDSYYKIHTTPKQWRDAKLACAQEGGSLLYPENSDEANAVIKFWKQYKNSTPVAETWVYVGMSDIITEGVHETIHGKSISDVYNHWKVGMPDNTNDEDCIHLNQEGVINDIRCDAEYSFICKKSLKQPCACEIEKTSKGGQRDKKFFRKDYTYIESVQSFYKIHTIGQTFADARRMCSLEGASLYYADDVEEMLAVTSFWNRTQPSIPWVFVGLTDEIAEGLFETVDQRPISEVYSMWHPFQPDNAGGKENCVHMDLKGFMNDYLCDSKAKFICKKRLNSLLWNNVCDMPNLDYSYNNGKCYKLHTTPKNWADAYAMCRIEYTSLAVISNKNEADYLAKLIQSTPTPRLCGQYQRGIYHVGFHNRNKDGWQTVKGTPMNVDPEMWFDNYQPDGDLYEECGSIYFDGRLINTKCDMKSLFICEKEVDSSNRTTAVDQNEENFF